jgi:hypothetical protein
MKSNSLLLTLGFLLLSAAGTLQSCSPKFDKIGFENISNLGTKLTDLMNLATEPYSKHKDTATTLLANLGKAYDHAKGVKGNKEIAESWRILKDELAGPFFARWQEKGKLDKDFVKESVAQVAKSVTAITNAEKAKKKK